jgi:hypothetical protein
MARFRVRRMMAELLAALALSLGAVALALVAGDAAAHLSAHAQTAPSPATATAAEVLRQVVERGGGRYAGDCAATRSPEDRDTICSKLVGERGDLRAYLLGRTFSEFSTWAFVEQTPSGWRFAGAAPLDFFAFHIAIPWPR